MAESVWWHRENSESKEIGFYWVCPTTGRRIHVQMGVPGAVQVGEQRLLDLLTGQEYDELN